MAAGRAIDVCDDESDEAPNERFARGKGATKTCALARAQQLQGADVQTLYNPRAGHEAVFT